MGNAALCPSCQAGKSVRAQGHLQELDRTPDYYGCHGEDTKELGPRVSSELQTGGEEDGGIRINTGPHWLKLWTSWKEADRIKPMRSNQLTASGSVACCCFLLVTLEVHVCTFWSDFSNELTCGSIQGCHLFSLKFAKLNIYFITEWLAAVLHRFTYIQLVILPVDILIVDFSLESQIIFEKLRLTSNLSFSL